MKMGENDIYWNFVCVRDETTQRRIAGVGDGTIISVQTAGIRGSLIYLNGIGELQKVRSQKTNGPADGLGASRKCS